MGFSRKRTGTGGRIRYTAVYRDLKRRQRSAGSFANRREADRAWQRALRGSRYKWLDLEALCHQLLPKDGIHRIRYFTAKVTARPGDPQLPVRQQTYLRALATLPTVSVHLSVFYVSTVRAPLAHPPERGPRTAEIIKTEEKGSDVAVRRLVRDLITSAPPSVQRQAEDFDRRLGVSR